MGRTLDPARQTQASEPRLLRRDTVPGGRRGRAASSVAPARGEYLNKRSQFPGAPSNRPEAEALVGWAVPTGDCAKRTQFEGVHPREGERAAQTKPIFPGATRRASLLEKGSYERSDPQKGSCETKPISPREPTKPPAKLPRRPTVRNKANF